MRREERDSILFKDDESRDFIEEHFGDNKDSEVRPWNQSLLKLLYELVVGMPALAEVQARAFGSTNPASIRSNFSC